MNRAAWSRVLLWLFLAGMSPAMADEPPASFVLAVVDVETTGLDPGYHEMVDLGVVYVDPDGRELDRLFVRIHPPHPQRLDPGAAAVNGYSVSRWQELGALEEAAAVAGWLAVHERASAGRRVYFTAFNAGFDQAFTTALLARHALSWRDLFHYQTLDLPSMAWGQGARALSGGELAVQYGIAAETQDPLAHTGATGADFNLALYRKLLERQHAAD